MAILTVSNDCYLTGADPGLEEVLKERLTIDNPKYIAAKRYGRWIGKKLKPTICILRSRTDGLCAFRAAFLIRRSSCVVNMGVEPQIIDRAQAPAGAAVQLSGRSLRALPGESPLKAVCSHSFGVLEAGTGSGKTVMALAAVCQRKQPTIVVVHTKELLYQWQERIARIPRY